VRVDRETRALRIHSAGRDGQHIAAGEFSEELEVLGGVTLRGARVGFV
jgi:hypothetical protein